MDIQDIKVKKPRKPRQKKTPVEPEEQQNNVFSVIIEKITDDPQPSQTPEQPDQTKEEIKPVKKPRGRKKKEEPEIQEIQEHQELELEPDNTPDNNTLQSNTQESTTPITTYQYTTPITYIYHISDIHIQLYRRHNEYQAIFDKVFRYLEGEKAALNIPATSNTNIPIIAAITGDTLHSKSDLSPECIQLTYNFLKTLASILPVVIIPGNHDININNRERLDSITPIIADLPTHYPIYYFLNSGLYQISNLLFYHASIFDYQIIPRQSLPTTTASNTTHIMLYHGRVNGAVLYNGLEIGETGNKTITPSAFAPYDITLLGDIHKQQFLAPNIAYAGSLIQQNLGEDIKNHGLIKWTVATKTGHYVQIPNDWSYITLFVENKKASHQCCLKDNKHDHNCELSQNLRVRILYKNTPESYISDYITLLKMNHNIHEFSFQNDDEINSTATQSSDEDDADQTNSSTISTSSTNKLLTKPSNQSKTIDITSPELQNKYIIEYINQNALGLTPEEITTIKEMNIKQNEILRETNKNYNSTGFSGHYKLKRLQFSNLFSYGGNNVIDFTNFKGVVGIIAPNHLGKSAILDIIIYALFDKFSRKGSTKDIVNIRADHFSLKLDILIGQWQYTITKGGIRGKTNTVSTKVEFFRTNTESGAVERLEEDTVARTKERISEYFGCYEDIIHTSFSIQQDNSCFIDAENTERRKELQRIMRFDIIDKLYEMANHQYNKFKDIREHIAKKIDNDFIVNTKKSKHRAERLLALHTENKAYAKERIKKINQAILEHSSQINKECEEFMKDNDPEYWESRIDELDDEIGKINIFLSDYDFDIKTIHVITEHIEETERIKECDIYQANERIKKVNNKIEELLKSRKPANIKLPPNTKDPLEYLTSQKNKYLETYQSTETEISNLKEAITNLRKHEATIKENNDKILELERQMIKLPDEFIQLSSSPDDISKLEMNFQNALRDYSNEYSKLITTSKAYPYMNQFETYTNLELKGEKFFFCKSISRYINNSESQNDTLIEQQNSLEQANKQLSSQLKEIPNHEKKIKELETVLSKTKMQLQYLEIDMSNIEINRQIDDKIAVKKLKKVDIEKEIDAIKEEISKLRHSKERINNFEILTVQRESLEHQLKEAQETYSKFDTYQQQIESNLSTRKTITALQTELAEFEEVYEEVERQYNQETANMTKYMALIDQIKKDIAENKAIESSLKLFDIYRKALKTLPYILLGKIQPVLEKKVNDLLSIITDFTVKFDMSDNKIDIYLDRPIYKTLGNSAINNINGKPVERYILINNTSGFEKFISSLAIRIALLDMSNLPKINFLALDEGFGTMDHHNINNVYNIFDYLKTKFQFILVISHITQVKEQCDMSISLKKNDKGYTEIIS